VAPGEVETKVADYLRNADRLLPDWVTGYHVVGSAALGEYVPGRSDLDFVAIVGDDLESARGERPRRCAAPIPRRAGRNSSCSPGWWRSRSAGPQHGEPETGYGFWKPTASTARTAWPRIAADSDPAT
jgi:hypothetical protein